MWDWDMDLELCKGLEGLDVVPLQPDLQQVGSSELASRITWVHYNLHIKRIALGVPEDKMLEEDLFFPGKLIDNDSDSEPESDSGNRSSLLSSQLNSAHSHSDTNVESITESVPPSASSYTSDGASPPTPTTAAFPATPSRSNSPVDQSAVNEEFGKEEAQELLAQVIGDYTISEEPSVDDESTTNDAVLPSTSRPLLHVKTPYKSRSLASQPIGTTFAGSAVSLIMSSVGSVAPSDSLYEIRDPQMRIRPRGYSLTESQPAPDSDLQLPGSPVAGATQKAPSVRPELMTVPKPPANPRDHSLLQAIYTRLLESRFINISPLALLTNSMGLYFRDVRTHPPLQYRFPAVPQKARRFVHDAQMNDDHSDTGYVTSDSDDARDAILPSPLPRSMKKRNSRRVSSQSYEEEPAPISEDNRYINVRGLLHNSSPYITLDESRASALSPSTKSMFPGLSSAKVQRGSFLPNTTMNLDLKTLNLHLALRAAEILACSESMWEWVLGYQTKAKARRAARTTVRSYRSGSGSIDLPPRRSITSVSSSRDSADPFKNSILDLTRDDFDSLLCRFELDMRDKCALGNALEDRFAWSVTESSPSAERKIFETACEKWDKWELERQAAIAAASTPSRHRYPPLGALAAPHPSPSTLHFSDHNDLGHGRQITQEKKRKRASTSSSTMVPPTRMMSRAMRVFVAWKP
ncbi:hypothetical protein D9615_002895 [Tricholomella constricta]|uniref:Uncharacterized protein n=1 Tax=Tricholomella constricta TaxID=117010 RepID=A0A8H5HG85_9AGAR|nr:hypothetical protein D9615_002895 [Tricholomella constricta]